MKWVPHAGTWVPSLSCSKGNVLSEEALLDKLQERLVDDIADHPVRVLELLRNDNAGARRCLFAEEREKASVADRTMVDWLGAVASDSSSPDAINQLQTARRDYFLGNLTEVIQRTTIDHLRRSIFMTWDYADPLEKQSLHLDPSEDRRHAHQWNQPSGDPNRKKSGGMLGANRLALEAMRFFVSVPKGDALQTTGFSGSRSTDTRWTWPIWDVDCSLQVVCSLLTLPAIQMEQVDEPARTALREWGVAAVFRTNRILVGKTPNFTPARRVA
jgi:CRISPR-associated endonuclease/helicase Cas3